MGPVEIFDKHYRTIGLMLLKQNDPFRSLGLAFDLSWAYFNEHLSSIWDVTSRY